MADGQGPEHDGRSTGRRYALPLVIATAALLAVSMIRHGSTESGPPQPASGEAPTGVSETATGGGPGDVANGGFANGDGFGPVPSATPSGSPQALGFSAPTEVRIPALMVDAPVTTVGPDGDGGVGAPPPEFKNLAGWYTGAPSPGQQGTAVIDGHVDNMQGPAVFYGLGALHKGNEVDVVRSDGSTAVFTIYGIEVLAKNDFPGDRVYGDTGKPELRVITCGGGFTKKTGYDSDVVVFARLSAVR